MKNYEEALHGWFLKNSGIPDRSRWSDGYTSGAATEEFRNHLNRKVCELVWQQDPEFDKIEVWGGTFNPHMPVTVLDADVSCTCEEGGYKSQTLRYTGEIDSLSAIILAVLAEGDSSEGDSED